MASCELETLGLARSSDVWEGFVIRQPGAYPVYDENYKKHLDDIRRYLDGFVNLQTIGRNGMHRYNNMDHSMLTGILAARNISGEQHDLWAVNDEDEYLEETRASRSKGPVLDTVVSRIFTRMDKTAFGIAAGTVAGLLLFLATVWLVIKGGPVVGPLMSLLSQFFFGYTVTVKGAVVGLVYGFLSGFCVGWLFALFRNFFLAFYLYRIRKAAELDSIKDFFDHM